jgi:hypothetical protein
MSLFYFCEQFDSGARKNKFFFNYPFHGEGKIFFVLAASVKCTETHSMKLFARSGKKE